MRINDEFGAHVDSTLYFIDVNVRQPLENVTALEKDIPSEVSAPGKDVIRWFSLDAYRGAYPLDQLIELHVPALAFVRIIPNTPHILQRRPNGFTDYKWPPRLGFAAPRGPFAIGF